MNLVTFTTGPDASFDILILFGANVNVQAKQPVRLQQSGALGSTSGPSSGAESGVAVGATSKVVENVNSFLSGIRATFRGDNVNVNTSLNLNHGKKY